MRKLITEERMIRQEVIVERKLYCDICRREIPKRAIYYECESNHNDWDNDSVDSYEKYQVCSDNCLSLLFDDYLHPERCPRFLYSGSEQTGRLEIKREKNW